MLEAGISTYLSHLSAKAHLKKKYSDKQAKTKGTICLFKNTSTINLFCHLLVRSKVNPKSAQASSPHKWGALFPAASSTHISWARDLSQLFGPSDVVHFKQGWPGTASGTLQTQAQMRISGCIAACCYPPYSFISFGPFCLFCYLHQCLPTTVLQPWKRPLVHPRIPPKNKNHYRCGHALERWA